MAEVSDNTKTKELNNENENTVADDETASVAEVKDNGNVAKADVTSKEDAGEAEKQTSEIPEKKVREIIRQVEYYFSDVNLARDKFLQEQISKDEEGWIPLEVLLTFKRLAALANDSEVVVNALLESDEGLVEIHEDRKHLRRHPERPVAEIDSEKRKELQARTAYAKGFPLEADMSELLDFFADYDKVQNIYMRKYKHRPTKTYKFKGSVFAVFETKEQAQAFIEQDKIVYKGRELLRKWQNKYFEEKHEEYESKKTKKNAAKTASEEFVLPTGTVVHFEGGNDTLTRELVRAAVEKIEGDWDIAYIDYNKGDKSGHLRFQTAGIAPTFIEKLQDKQLKIDDETSLTMRLLEDEEEKTFLAKVVENMKRLRSKGFKHSGNRKRGRNFDRRDNKKKRFNDE